MKRLIILKQEWLDPKGKDKAAQYKEQVAICKNSVKEFRDGIKELIANKSVKIIREYDIVAQVIIEFDEKNIDVVYKQLRSLNIVETIDTHLPKED